MSNWVQRLAFRWFAREQVVPIADCVHFCGFRYGCGDYHPYESYLIDVVTKGDAINAAVRFHDFLQYYRPRDMGAALGVSLARTYPLWNYPWSWRRLRDAGLPAGWHRHHDSCPDILTHFAEHGIRRCRIAEEFGWLERALVSIREHGYQPRKFKSAIHARRLLRTDGRSAWLLLDGNHRVAALSALGHTEVPVRFLPWATVQEARIEQWWQVKNGFYTIQDAMAVFSAYFEGNRRPFRSAVPAAIWEVEP